MDKFECNGGSVLILLLLKKKETIFQLPQASQACLQKQSVLEGVVQAQKIAGEDFCWIFR